MSFLSVLTIVFIVLKLTNYITWSWWFVLMPIYLAPIFFILLMVKLNLLGLWVFSRSKNKNKNENEND